MNANLDLLQPGVQTFIIEHESDDVRSLAFKTPSVYGVPFSRIADQINGRRKARIKLPLFHAARNIIYPPGINLEQSSSEQTAQFKASLAGSIGFMSRSSCVDLTGGFGIDTLFLSRTFDKVHYVEPNEELLIIARHNHIQLGASNIEYHNSEARTFLKGLQTRFDLIYVDPSRRSGVGNRRRIRLDEYNPDMLSIGDLIFERSDHCMVKASPMIDLTYGLDALRWVIRTYVVAVDSEVKEVLFLCKRGHIGEPVIEAVNLSRDAMDTFAFRLSNERSCSVNFGEPLKYLYEPNAALLKSGAFRSIGARFRLAKLHSNTHLYTSEHLLAGFPGRVFHVEAVFRRLPGGLKEYFPKGRGSVMVRNYPLAAEQLKKKAGLREGGNKVLIGFTGPSGKMVAVARREY